MDDDDDRRLTPEESGEWSELESSSTGGEVRSPWSTEPMSEVPAGDLEAPVNPSAEGPVEAGLDESEGGGVAPSSERTWAGRRQARRPGSPRRNVHQVKATDEAERRLVARAGERGITVSRLLLEAALSGGAEAAKTKADLAGELFRTNRLLLKLGVNMNQIAAATNATLEEQPGHVGALAAVTRLSARIEGLLDEIELPADYDRSRSVPGVGDVDEQLRAVDAEQPGTRSTERGEDVG